MKSLRSWRRGRSIRRWLLLAAFVAVAMSVLVVIAPLGSDERAGAFGSVRIPLTVQRPMHEAITRVLACTSSQRPSECFEPGSIDLLAGTDGTFGAVAEPDNPLDGFPNPASRHCDDADYGYGDQQSQAEAWLELARCVDAYQRYLDFSLESASGLLNSDGSISAPATAIFDSNGLQFSVCSFPDPLKGHTSLDVAKCNVLNGIGRALHIYEDFWSHSNWGDVADPTRPVDASNIAGLGRIDQPPYFAYPTPVATTFVEGLVSGCDDSLGAGRCTQKDRFGHSVVNKDNAETVDATTCQASQPLTPRGRVTIDGVSNFQRAVTGACGAALRAWTDFRSALITRYGTTTAQTMIRAIIADTPTTRCLMGGASSRARATPVGERASARSMTVTLVNESGLPLTCGRADLDSGEWADRPPDSIDSGASVSWRTQSNGLATGTSGSAVFTIGDTASTVAVTWGNPFVGGNTSSCDVAGGFVCATSGGSGDQASLVVTIRPA